MPLTPDVAEVRLVRQGPLACVSEQALLEELRVALDAARIGDAEQTGFATWSLDAQLGWLRVRLPAGTTGAWLVCGETEVSLFLAVVDGRRAEVRTISVPVGPAVEPDLAQGTREVLARLGVASAAAAAAAALPEGGALVAIPAATAVVAAPAAAPTGASAAAAVPAAPAEAPPDPAHAASGAGRGGGARDRDRAAAGRPLVPELAVGATGSWVEAGSPAYLGGGEVAGGAVVGPVRLRLGVEVRAGLDQLFPTEEEGEDPPLVSVGPRLGLGLPIPLGPMEIEPGLTASYLWSRLSWDEEVTWWSPEVGASVGVHGRLGPRNRLGVVAEARLDLQRERVRDLATRATLADTGRHGAAVRLEWTWLGKVRRDRRQDVDG